MGKHKYLLIFTALFMVVFLSSCAEFAKVKALDQELALVRPRDSHEHEVEEAAVKALDQELALVRPRDSHEHEVEEAAVKALDQELALVRQDLEKIEQADRVAEEKALQLMEKGFPIAIYEHFPGTPNSADGVNVIIFWKNISPKDIKYVTFTVRPFNAVDDVVYCSISNKADSKLRVTGPVEARDMEKPDSSVWDNVWYNNTIERIEIVQIDIIYMDNTEVSISASEVKDMFIDRYALYREYGVSSID